MGQAGDYRSHKIATDDSNKVFFDEIVTKKRLVSLYDFENREADFPRCSPLNKFCLLTLSGVRKRPHPSVRIRFFPCTRQSNFGERERRFALSTEDFTLSSPTPEPVRSSAQAGHGDRSQDVPPRWRTLEGGPWQRTRGNPWGVSFMQMFNMTSGLLPVSVPARNWRKKAGNFTATCSHGVENVTCPCTKPSYFTNSTTVSPLLMGFQADDVRKGNARPMTSEKRQIRAPSLSHDTGYLKTKY